MIVYTHVVAVWVLYEREGVIGDLVHELNALMLRRMVNATLEDTATVAMSRDLDAVRRNGVVDKLYQGINTSVRPCNPSIA